jgi:hypothetical protein
LLAGQLEQLLSVAVVVVLVGRGQPHITPGLSPRVRGNLVYDGNLIPHTQA